MTAAFIAGFKYALGPGGRNLHQEIKNEVYREAMRDLNALVDRRVKEALNGH